MRLADFIESEMAAILANWEAFAVTQLPASSHLQTLALRLQPRNCGYTGARHAERCRSLGRVRRSQRGFRGNRA